MPDIAMCQDEDCPVCDLCYLFTAKPSQYRQSYMQFTRDEPDGSCSSFTPNRAYQEEYGHDPR